MRDEYGLTSTFALAPLTISEPPGNAAPTSVITPPTCVGLTCNLSGATSSDPDVGDAITYAWDFGDLTSGTSASASHVYTTPGTYLLRLTVTDGWGNFTTTTRQVTVAP